MSKAWNFERRQIVCAKFIVGVSLVVKSVPDATTSLEAVRNRVRLPPEDALFAARRLGEEQLIEFEPGGTVTSTRKGIAHATDIVARAVANTQRVEEIERALRDGGTAFEMLKLAVLTRGGMLECAAEDPAAPGAHRVRLAGDVVTLERETSSGSFEVVGRYPPGE